jgi:hypothetical protein
MIKAIYKVKVLVQKEVADRRVYEGSYISLPMYLGPETDHRRGSYSFKGLCLAGSIQLGLCDSLPERGFKGKEMPHNRSITGTQANTGYLIGPCFGGRGQQGSIPCSGCPLVGN